MSYKVEELLALRDSVSESAVSIDKFADEDVIKEHVLRPSISATAVGNCPAERPLRPATTTPGVSIANTNLKKPSPSPSIKRGKAEQLLKEHGSPPGMRVTAGGRVVPSDLPPVRFGNTNNMKPLGTRSVDAGNPMSAQMQSEVNNNNLTPQVLIMGDSAVMRLGDRMYALPTYTGQGAPSFSMPSVVPPVHDIPKPTGDSMKLPVSGGMPGNLFVPPRNPTPLPAVGMDVSTLQAQYNAKKLDLKAVEQTEVLQADTQGPVWRQGMIAKKKSLILELDTLRKQIDKVKSAEGNPAADATGHASIGLQAPNAPQPALSPAFMPQYTQPVAQPMVTDLGALTYGFPPQTSYPPLMMYPPFVAPSGLSAQAPEFGRDRQLFDSTENVGGKPQFPGNFTQPAKAPHSPGSATRRSHAVPIKKPTEDTKKPGGQFSTLDPKSPTYEPALRSNGNLEAPTDGVPPTPSPAKRSSWRSNEIDSALSSRHEDRVLSHKPSLSSVDTMDFFPTNTHEHSSTRVAPEKMSKQPSRENVAAPTTPEKPWAFGPWNPPSDGRSTRADLINQIDPTRKLTSWPEAFGTNGKSSSLASSAQKTFPESRALRNASEQNTAAESNWPLLHTKPVYYSPSTYQEGYQAGLHHLGLPDNFEVMNGFIDGLVAYLKERGAKEARHRNGVQGVFSTHQDYSGSSSARSSLRGVLSGATLHDSTASLAENIRSAKTSSLPSAAFAKSAYTPRMDGVDGPITYTLCNEAAREPMQRLGTNLPKSPIGTAPAKDELLQSNLTSAPLAAGRHFSGARIENRAQVAPASMQRYYPTPKEMGTGLFSSEVPLSARGPTRQRFSGLDGAMDDLAGLVVEPSIDEKQGTVETVEAEASCFKSAKGKQKMSSSPTKSATGNGKEIASSPKAPSSPKKSGEHSPAKARLEQVTNKLRRPKKDVRAMSPEEKHKRTETWRKRFSKIKDDEQQEIVKYARDNGRPDASRR